MKAFKAFDKDMRCRGFQYEVGKTYEEQEASLCYNGFHACENPLDVLNYYDLTESRFAEVELDATDEKQKGDSKRVGKKIHIKAEFSLKYFIKASIDFLIDSTKQNEKAETEEESGDSAKLASSGYFARLASSGDSAQLASSGDSAKLASSGDSAQLASSGDYAVVMCAGVNGIAKAKKGSWITLSEWVVEDGIRKPRCVKTEQVDGERIKEDVFYRLENCEFVEVEE